MARTPLRDGDPSRVGGYRLTARLGAGGMGVVYLGAARDGRLVAVKVLRPELADAMDFRVRFRREVASLTRVQGQCTVRVIEAETESPQPFLVTEYADGPSLAEHVAEAGPMSPQMLYGLATGLAEALTAIHAAGVIHRDLKPANVLLTAAGPKVIDFGIAQTLDATAVTRTGMTLGSPGYMAPEQIAGRAGQAADVFAWGLVIAFTASGEPPFGGGPSDVILYRILHGTPGVTAVPTELRPLVDAALAKNPAERPTAGQLLSWLTRAAADAGGSPTQLVLARTWLPPVSAGPAYSGQTRRWRRPLVLLSAAALAAAAAGTGLAMLDGSPKATAGPPASRTHASDGPTTDAPATTSPAAPTTDTPNASPPLLVAGGYSGVQPTTLYMGASQEIVSAIWSQWQAPSAVGVAQYPVDNCVPTCAAGKTSFEQVIVRLGGIEGASPGDGGHFTTFVIQNYSTGAVIDDEDFPSGASGGIEGNH
jgi:serine/threonine protein kinase